MSSLHHFVSKNARFFEVVYNIFEPIVRALGPLWRGIGFGRIEKLFTKMELWTKIPLFGCQMCGQCILSSTGMSCSMNCPKEIRNGPCGGVNSDGTCEVIPTMRCVWVEAWNGSQKMKGGEKINELQPPVDHRIKGTSSWLRHLQDTMAHKDTDLT
jgi:hypothetical protein